MTATSLQPGKILNKHILFAAILITLFLGTALQGGTIFWFGLANLSSFALLLFYIHKNYDHTVKLPKSIVSNIIILFCIWCFATVLWSPVTHISIIIAFIIFATTIGLFLYYFLTHNAIKWSSLWFIIIIFGTVLSIYSVVQVASGVNTPSTLFINQNTYSAYLNLIILPTAGYLLIAKDKTTTIILSVTVFLLVFSAALPGSRGATTGQAIGMVLLVLMAWKITSRKRLILLVSLYALALILATLTTSNMLRFIEKGAEQAVHSRHEIWEGSISLLKDTPWYGNGVGTYWLMYPAHRSISDPNAGQNAHNDYLQYWIEAGLPSVLLLLALIIAVFYIWWQSIKKQNTSSKIKIETTAIVAALVAIGFHSFFTSNLTVYSILFLIGLLLGRLIDLSNQTRKISLAKITSINKKYASLLLIAILIFLTAYNASIISFSHYYAKGTSAFISGDLKSARQFNTIAQSLYPHDARSHLLDANILSVIIGLKETPVATKTKLTQQTLQYFDRAKKINPLRTNNYYFHARFLQQHKNITVQNKQLVEQLYTKALAVDPRHIASAKALIKYYLSSQNIDMAAAVAFNSIKYWHPPTGIDTLNLYKIAEIAIQQHDDESHKKLLSDKLSLAFEALKMEGAINPKKQYLSIDQF